MTQVLIPDILPLTQAIAVGSQTVYSTTWTANYASDVVVYSRAAGVSANDNTQILDPSLYTVSFVGSQNIVQVTLVNPSTAGDIVTMTRMTPADRENLYTNTNFTPSMLNNDFGILTLVDQQAQLVNQVIGPRYNYSAVINAPGDTILPILTANQFWVKDPTNTFIQAVDINEIISGGTVTEISTGLGLTGGPITDAGTISFAPIAANSFWANLADTTGLPTVTSLDNFLLSTNNLDDLTNIVNARANLGLVIGTDVQAFNAALASIAGLTTVANNLIYTTGSNTYHVLAPANNSSLITSNTGVPSWSQTLPQAVQTNIQYLGVQNQDLNMGGFQINNGSDPTQPSDFATKNYVDLNALTGTNVYAATTGDLTVTQAGSGVGATLTNAGAQATFALDSVNPPVGSNVLIKDLAAPQHDGIYTVTNAGSGSTNWILTRATTYDTPSEINNVGLIIVQNGSTLAGTAWYNSVTIVTVDTTALSYSEFGNIVFPVSLAHGGTNANLTASNGGIVYSTSTAFAILSGTATANQMLQSGANSAPTWSTSTWPTTTTINQLLFSSANNVVGGITASNNGVLISSASSVPSWLAAGTTGQILTATTGSPPAWAPPEASGIVNSGLINQLAWYAAAGTAVSGLTITNSAGLLTNGSGVPGWVVYTGTGAPMLNISPRLITSLLDTNGNTILTLNPQASAVNSVSINNNITGFGPGFTAVGSDTNIPLTLLGKGTGGVPLRATGTNDAAAGGYVGELVTAAIVFGSAVSISSGAIKDVTTISLTAGDWDVWGSVGVSVTVAMTNYNSWVSATSATLPDLSLVSSLNVAAGAAQTINSSCVPQQRMSLSGTTTIYLSTECVFTGTGVAYGTINARRRR